MKGAPHLGLWNLLLRVRGIRVERAHRHLSEARVRAECTGNQIRQLREAIGRHEAARPRILNACSLGAQDAPLWRMALRQHAAQQRVLEMALLEPCRIERLVRAQVDDAVGALRREIHRREDARVRVCRLSAARRDEEEPDG